MTNKGVFLGSLIGGVILGSALTILCHSKSAGAMRRDAHARIMHELEHLRAHICTCKDGSCSLESMGDMEGMHHDMQSEEAEG